MIKIIRLPKKEIIRRTGWTASCQRRHRHWEILVPYKAKPITILHEIGHAKLHHRGSKITTIRECFFVEMEAYLFALRILKKRLTYAYFVATCIHAWDYFEGSVKINDLFNGFVHDAEHIFGLEMDSDIRSSLWWALRDHYNKLHGKGAA